MTDPAAPLLIGSEDTAYVKMLGEDDDGLVGIHEMTPTSSLHGGGSFALPIDTKTADYTADGDDYTLLIDASSVAVTITLPTAAGITGRIYVIKAIDITNTADVDGNGAETIDGVASYTFTSQYESITIQSDGTNWMII